MPNEELDKSGCIEEINELLAFNRTFYGSASISND
jgi:hypothetical protein